MGKWVRLLSSVVGIGAVSLFARAASANEPATAGRLQAGVGFRYGFELEKTEINPWGAGIGAKLGYTLPNALYFGVNAEYFFGDSYESVDSSSSYHLWQAMLEGGYDIAVGQAFVIRPKVGLGFASNHMEWCGPGSDCKTELHNDLAVAPGIDCAACRGRDSIRE